MHVAASRACQFPCALKTPGTTGGSSNSSQFSIETRSESGLDVGTVCGLQDGSGFTRCRFGAVRELKLRSETHLPAEWADTMASARKASVCL